MRQKPRRFLIVAIATLALASLVSLFLTEWFAAFGFAASATFFLIVRWAQEARNTR